MTPSALTVLLQLASPALPIGGLSYSQGFESAVSEGLISNGQEASMWLIDHMMGPFASCECPVWLLLFEAWRKHDLQEISYWNEWFWASRETHEFRLETEQMGWSLIKLSEQLGWGDEEDKNTLGTIQPITYPCAHAYACARQGLDRDPALTAYAFSWLENQVMAAIKSIPLGQTAGQKILQTVGQRIQEVVDQSIERASMHPPQINTFAHQLAILSSRHETQYSRLFRS